MTFSSTVFFEAVQDMVLKTTRNMNTRIMVNVSTLVLKTLKAFVKVHKGLNQVW